MKAFAKSSAALASEVYKAKACAFRAADEAYRLLTPDAVTALQVVKNGGALGEGFKSVAFELLACGLLDRDDALTPWGALVVFVGGDR